MIDEATLKRVRAFLPNIAQLLDEVKMDRSREGGLPWNHYHDGLRSEATSLMQAIDAAS